MPDRIQLRRTKGWRMPAGRLLDGREWNQMPGVAE